MLNLMMPMLCMLGAYLLGSVSFAIIASRLFGLADPRSYGSKNPGATNVLRSGSKKAALFTLIGDALKGTLAVLIAQYYALPLGLGDWGVPWVGVCAFLGHLFPIFLGFKGGKGVATSAGVLLAIDPWLGVVALGSWLFVAYVFRYSSLAAIVAAILAPLYALLDSGVSPLSLAVSVISILLIWKHWPNLMRLMAGKEPKIGAKK